MRFGAPALLVFSTLAATYACSSTTPGTTPEEDSGAPTPTASPSPTTPPADPPDAAAETGAPATLPKGQMVLTTGDSIKLVGLGGAEPKTPTTLVPAGAYETSDPSFLTDGRIVYVRKVTGSREIHAVKDDGTGDVTLATIPDESALPLVSAPQEGFDGNVYFLRATTDLVGSTTRLMAVPVTGGTPKEIAKMPDSCSSGLMTISPDRRTLLVRTTPSCTGSGFALIPVGPAPNVVIEEMPASSNVGFDATNTRLWIATGQGGVLRIARADLQGVPSGAQQTLEGYTGRLPARMIPTGADSVMFFGTPVTHVSVSNASASFVTVGEGEDASMASFRAVP